MPIRQSMRLHHNKAKVLASCRTVFADSVEIVEYAGTNDRDGLYMEWENDAGETRFIRVPGGHDRDRQLTHAARIVARDVAADVRNPAMVTAVRRVITGT